MDGFDRLPQEYQALTGRSLTSDQLALSDRYADLMVEANQKINLTAITSPEDVRIKHFLDSFSLTLATGTLTSESVIDIGTGAGFPGLPLKLLFPEIRLTLVDSVAKKTGFLDMVVQELGLSQVRTITDRAEALGQQPAHRQAYDWALARAVASLPALVEYLLPLVKVGGNVLVQKGESAQRELAAAQKAIRLLGGGKAEVIPVRLPGIPDQRFLILIPKLRRTPAEYPRRVGIPAKDPL
jgi:16S rRNA (guanine527-N7)-methyltransferase